MKRRWAKELLQALSGLDRWWLTQASIDIVEDRELMAQMARSGCIEIFVGIESFDVEALASVDERQNRVAQYRDGRARFVRESWNRNATGGPCWQCRGGRYLRSSRQPTTHRPVSALVQSIAAYASAIIEVVGVALIALLSLYALARAGIQVARKSDAADVYPALRQRLGRGILLGLEFLVAADIIHTVAVDLTFATVSVLAIIVAIRTFLSFALELEVTGRWPWQGRA